jgi:hypothetical protein
LKVGLSGRDVALIVQACQRIGIDLSIRYVVDLLKTLPTLTDNVLGQRIRNNGHDEVAVGFTLHRERLSEVEGGGIWKVIGLPGIAVLLGQLGFQRGLGSLQPI